MTCKTAIEYRLKARLVSVKINSDLSLPCVCQEIVVTITQPGPGERSALSLLTENGPGDAKRLMVLNDGARRLLD